MLDENNQLIQCIMEYQSRGKASECAQYVLRSHFVTAMHPRLGASLLTLVKFAAECCWCGETMQNFPIRRSRGPRMRRRRRRRTFVVVGKFEFGPV